LSDAGQHEAARVGHGEAHGSQHNGGFVLDSFIDADADNCIGGHVGLPEVVGHIVSQLLEKAMNHREKHQKAAGWQK
jgi:hypothetical protein